MTTEDAFIDDIREHPDEDAPRLIFADWLDDHGDPDRGDFIRTQVARHHAADGSPAEAELRRKASSLLEKHWDAWARPLWPLIDYGGRRLPMEAWLGEGYRPNWVVRFPRGFLDQVILSARQMVRRDGELFRRVPLRALQLVETDGVADEVAACPHLRGVERLQFLDIHREPIDDAFLAALATSPHLGFLRRLDLNHHHVGDRGCESLAAAAWLGGVRVLVLSSNGIGPEGARRLARAGAFRPEALALNGNTIGDAGVAALAASPVLEAVRVLKLGHCGVGSAGAAALAYSPYARHLRELDLSDNNLRSADWDLLASAPWWAGVRRVTGTN